MGCSGGNSCPRRRAADRGGEGYPAPSRHHHAATLPTMPPVRFAAVAVACTASSLAAQTNWTLLAPATTPVAFTAHTTAYHLPTDRTLLFGGTYAGVRYNETWLWDGATWTQAAPATVPPARVAHAMAYDVSRARLVMFGGIPAGGGYLGDTWEWDGIDWQLMTPVASPAPRRSHPMAFLPSRSTVILWGGYAGGDLNDTWEWNGVNWSPILTAASPAPRRASEMALDPATGGLLLFSGYLQTNDTWLFDGTNWVQQFPATSPPARYDHSMIGDPIRNRVVMFGGPGAADTWEWDGSNWLNRTPATLPAARSDTYLSYDVVREEILMFGSSPTPETWVYRVVQNATFTPSGTGCPGTLLQAPVLSSTDRPWLGETFTADVAPVPPNTIGLMLYGLSDTVSSLGPLPLPLAAVGMPGCSLQVDPVLIDAFLAFGQTATWALPIPNAAALLGVQIYCQGAALDAGANALGIIVANHGAMLLGGK
jgi:hypothetical protein